MEELLCPCELLIPLFYNPEREGEPPKPVEAEVMTDIFSAFNRQFEGYSILGETQGSWHGQIDRAIRVEIAVLERRIDELKAVVRTIGQKLKQKAMYLKIGAPSVLIMPIEDPKEEG